MATRGVAMKIPFIAWDTANNVGKTGDAANITMQWVKDGVLAALTTPTVTEIGAAVPGLYSVDVTAVETDANIGVLHGLSASANVSIIPVHTQFERLPDAAPLAAGGVLDVQRIYGDDIAAQKLSSQMEYIERGVIQSIAGTSTALEDTTQTSVIDLTGMILIIVSTQGKKLQTRRIESYTPATQVAIVDRVWDVDPTGETYHVLGLIL